MSKVVTRPALLVDSRYAKGLVKAQFYLMILVVVGCALQYGVVRAKSIGLGMAVAWCAHVYAAWRSFYRPTKISCTPKAVVVAMMHASMGRLVIVMLGYGVVFRFITSLESGMLILGLMLIQLMVWVYPLLLCRK